MRYRIYFVKEDNTNGFATVDTLAEAWAFVQANPKSRVFCGRYEVIFRPDGTYRLR